MEKWTLTGVIDHAFAGDAGSITGADLDVLCKADRRRAKKVLSCAWAAKGWIEVEKKHPPEGQNVLTIDAGDDIRILYWDGQDWYSPDDDPWYGAEPEMWHLLQPVPQETT